jgi:hypothetical protein
MWRKISPLHQLPQNVELKGLAQEMESSSKRKANAVYCGKIKVPEAEGFRVRVGRGSCLEMGPFHLPS